MILLASLRSSFALVLASCALAGCASTSRAVQRSGIEDDVNELAVRRVLLRPELGDWGTLCLLIGPQHEATRAPVHLMRRFEKDRRAFVTANSYADCWASARRFPGEDVRIAPIFLAPVQRAGENGASVRASFACGHHGCVQSEFTLRRDSSGWRVVTERSCDESAGFSASSLDPCPEE